MIPKRKKHLYNFWRPPYQLKPPLNHLKRAEVQEVTNSLNPEKSSGYDLITGKILKELPIIEIKYLTQLFTAVLLKGHWFPAQWKVTQIILILKPGKPNELTSYRPISLLPTEYEVFKRFLLKRLLPTVENNRLIPNHQFGFRQRQSTTEQTHQILQRINEALEKQYCSAAFYTSVKHSTKYGILDFCTN
jgi:hypothetical protein